MCMRLCYPTFDGGSYKGKFAAGDKKASKDGLRYVFLLGDGDFAYGPASIPGLDEVYQEGKTYEVELP